MPLVKTEAIVLRTIDWSETSLIAWVFTRERGRLHVMAKGARRPRSGFEGALEPLVRGELISYQRKKAGDGLEIAKELDPHERHTGLRKDLQRLYRGLYVGELLLELSEKELPSQETFDAASQALLELCHEEPGQLDRPLFRCELRLLEAAGIAPRLDACARCGAVAPATGPGHLAFSPAAGGLLCAAHAREERDPLGGAGGGPNHAGGAVWPGPEDPAETEPSKRRRWGSVPPPQFTVSRGALRTLLALREGSAVSVGGEVSRELRGLLDGFFTWHLERPLKIPRTLRELAVGTVRARSRAPG